jgi:hypothetical protein
LEADKIAENGGKIKKRVIKFKYLPHIDVGQIFGLRAMGAL